MRMSSCASSMTRHYLVYVPECLETRISVLIQVLIVLIDHVKVFEEKIRVIYCTAKNEKIHSICDRTKSLTVPCSYCIMEGKKNDKISGQ